MKKLLVALSLLFIAGCSSNGDVLDAEFWAKNYNKVRTYAVDLIVPDKVSKVVDTVVYEATTSFDQKVKDCEKMGGTMGHSEVCRGLPQDK